MARKSARRASFILLLLLALSLAACGASPAANGAAKATESIPPVRSSTSVMAEGKAIPIQDAALSFKTNGVVGEVLVTEGSTVQANQPLLRLEGSERLQAAVTAAQLELDTAQQAITDLNNNAAVARSQALLNLATAQKELDKAQTRTESKEYQRGDQEQIDTARANYIIAQDGVSKATELYDKLDNRAEDDPIRAEGFSQLAAARQKRDTALANLNYLLDKPDQLDVAQIDAQLAVAQAKVKDAERQMLLVRSGPNSEQLALAQTRVKNAVASLDAAKAGLNDLELRAPFAGTISSIDISSGEFASPGVAVVHIADFSKWTVETTDLTELNVARIQMGQPALVQFDALPGIDMIGRVSQIKSFGENRQGDVVYTVVMNLENPDPRLRWNMTASVTFLEKDSSQ